MPARAEPRLSLAVGVTGHRDVNLSGADRGAIEAAVADVLARLQRALDEVRQAHAAAFAPEAARLRLVSALADGADTLVAKSALAAGWRLDACLPFTREEYAGDFAEGAAREELATLLGSAGSCFELPGRRAESEAAYEGVGRLVLEQSDVLLALWDGDLNRGRGGTSRVVAEAVARHIPVIHVHTHADAPVQVLWSGLGVAEVESPGLESVPRGEAGDAIPRVIAALTMPPGQPIDQRMLQRFYRERSSRSMRALPYPLLLAATGVQALSRRDLRPLQAQASTSALLAQAGGAADPPGSAALLEPIAHRYGIADVAATYFARVFRSGFVGNFTLAGIAVVLALSGLLAPSLKLTLISAELACVILILANTQAGRRLGWHERWMDNRHLAEQLRCLALTSLAGDLGLRDHTGTRDAAAVPGWVGWLVRATAREAGLPTARADAEYVARVRDAALRLVGEQIAYHRSNARRMHKLEHRLHRAGEFLFGATLAACTGWILVKLTGLQVGSFGKVGVTEIVTFATAALPALGAAIYGIRMQGDFAGGEFRSEVTVARLERLARAMADDPAEHARLQARLRSLADIMLSDVAHWRTTYRARPLTLPG
jgi:hypothetical protein